VVRVTLAPGVAQQVGLEFVEVRTKVVAETIRANAETQYVPSKLSKVAPRMPGVIREVKAVLGQEIEAGAALAVLDSADVGEAKSLLLQAIGLVDLRQKTWEQEKELAEKKITGGREALVARTELEEARLAKQRAEQRLLSLGLTPAQVADGAAKRDVSSLIELLAPFQGTIVEASAVAGEMASRERPLFAIAAMERMWIAIDVVESDFPKIAKDQKVAFTVEGLPGQKFIGKIAAIGGEVDDRTRTVKIYGDVKNTQGLLRAKMFGRAEITIKPADAKLLVPKAAVQNDGDCNLVFVSPSRDVFQARKIELGIVYENGFEVLGGLAAGEKVVTTGSFLLKTEVLRGQMGAG
jgi:cobalt-zinc-cadmium efflux system membrane fusion protein